LTFNQARDDGGNGWKRFAWPYMGKESGKNEESGKAEKWKTFVGGRQKPRVGNYKTFCILLC